MIETETLIRWTHELTEFVNGGARLEATDLFTAADVTEDPEFYDAREERTPEQVAATRKRAKVYLAELSLWAPSKSSTPEKLLSMARLWLNDPLVRSAHWAHEWTPMNGVLSLAEDGRLQLTPDFRSPDAQFAATFAELIHPKAPAMIKRCSWCHAFFVIVKVGRGRGAPRELCDPHSHELARTKKKPEWAREKSEQAKNWSPNKIILVHDGSGYEFRNWYEELPNPLLERCDCKLWSGEPRHYRLKRKRP